MYNPTNSRITRPIKVPLYYTGLTKQAVISLPNDDQHWTTVLLNRDFSVEIDVDLMGQSMAYYVVK